MVHQVWIRGLVQWCEPRRLLGPGEWRFEAGSASGTLSTHEAADLDARMRGIGIGGGVLEFTAQPPLPRSAVRAARTTDARRRRETSPGFTRVGTRLDDEGKVSLTPEALALAIGERAGGRSVVDAGCGGGGSAIGFARAGCAVVAVERDARRLADAEHNARVYGVAGSIRFVHGPVERVIADVEGDILFVDPPWGVDWSRSGVSIADLPLLVEILAMRRDQFAETWVKVPPSFDVRGVPGAMPEAWYGVAPGDHRRVKFLLLKLRR